MVPERITPAGAHAYEPEGTSSAPLADTLAGLVLVSSTQIESAAPALSMAPWGMVYW
jgi:hypothetical protein